jgi:hypothetical protein
MHNYYQFQKIQILIMIHMTHEITKQKKIKYEWLKVHKELIMINKKNKQIKVWELI